MRERKNKVPPSKKQRDRNCRQINSALAAIRPISFVPEVSWLKALEGASGGLGFWVSGVRVKVWGVELLSGRQGQGLVPTFFTGQTNQSFLIKGYSLLNCRCFKLQVRCRIWDGLG